MASHHTHKRCLLRKRDRPNSTSEHRNRSMTLPFRPREVSKARRRICSQSKAMPVVLCAKAGNDGTSWLGFESISWRQS